MGFGFGMGFDQAFGMFNAFGIMSTIVFIVVIGVFVVTFVQGISQWNKNNNSPRLTVPATVVAKRTHMTRRHHGGVNGHHHHRTSTSYHVTFQVESGDRIELRMTDMEYGLLVEGDSGKLTFQGTRYLGFQRL